MHLAQAHINSVSKMMRPLTHEVPRVHKIILNSADKAAGTNANAFFQNVRLPETFKRQAVVMASSWQAVNSDSGRQRPAGVQRPCRRLAPHQQLLQQDGKPERRAIHHDRLLLHSVHHHQRHWRHGDSGPHAARQQDAQHHRGEPPEPVLRLDESLGSDAPHL